MRVPFVFSCPLGTLAMLGVAALTACSQTKPAAPSPTPAPSSNANCTVQLMGNLSSSLTLPSCGELSSSASEAGIDDFALNFQFATQGLSSLNISIALGPSPLPGSYSSESTSEWSATGITSNECGYTAGSESVPAGSFKLTLRAIEIADAGADSGTEATPDASMEAADAGTDADTGADAGTDADADADADADTDADTDAGDGMEPRAGVVHGTLELTMYVLAPPATDCGAGDVESVVVDF